jgi:methyl-accepting chemotaxis protein
MEDLQMTKFFTKLFKSILGFLPTVGTKIKKNLPTLRAKIIIMLILVSLLPVLLTGISSYYASKNVLSEKLETTSTQTINEVVRGLDRYFNAMSNLVRIMADDKNIKNADNVVLFNFAKEFIDSVQKSDDEINDIFVGTEAGFFYTNLDATLPTNYDHKTTPWYEDAINNPNMVVITDPYISAISNKLVVSIATGIMKDNKFIGVVGMDINLGVISKSLSETKIGDSGYLFITDKNGTVIAHPDRGLIGTTRPTALPFWKEAKDNPSGFSSYEVSGEQKFSTYTTSQIAGWKVITSMNYSELQNDTNVILKFLFMILTILIITTIVVAILFSLPIAKNINTLKTAYEKVAQGDLTVSVNIKSKDEFTLLGNNFNYMVRNISDLIENVSIASNTVLETSEILANVAQETDASVTEVSRAVDEVAHGATEQAQNASDGASNVTELASKLTLIEESTEHMDELSKSTNKLTQRGLEQVENLIQKSDHTMLSTTKVTDLVNETSLSIEQINAISDTIDMITEQTTLLSLNASIEAARAGEYGKGFAVVANEIRKLADQSKTSTVQIKRIVDDINKKTTLSVKAMKETELNVMEQVTLVDQTQKIFREIMESVHSLTEKVSEIKNSTVEIAAKKENIVYQIENISAISEEAASATEEVTASTEQIAVSMDEITRYATELHSLSETLQEKLNTFQFNNTQPDVIEEEDVALN